MLSKAVRKFSGNSSIFETTGYPYGGDCHHFDHALEDVHDSKGVIKA